jgi:hypothetical protein
LKLLISRSLDWTMKNIFSWQDIGVHKSWL